MLGSADLVMLVSADLIGCECRAEGQDEAKRLKGRARG